MQAALNTPRVTSFEKLKTGIRTHKSLSWRDIWRDDNRWQHIGAALFENLPCGMYIGVPLFRGYVSDSQIPVIATLSQYASQPVWGCLLTLMAGAILLTYIRGDVRQMLWTARINEALWGCIASILLLTATPGIGTILTCSIFFHEHRRCNRIERDYEASIDRAGQ